MNAIDLFEPQGAEVDWLLKTSQRCIFTFFLIGSKRNSTEQCRCCQNAKTPDFFAIIISLCDFLGGHQQLYKWPWHRLADWRPRKSVLRWYSYLINGGNSERYTSDRVSKLVLKERHFCPDFFQSAFLMQKSLNASKLLETKAQVLTLITFHFFFCNNLGLVCLVLGWWLRWNCGWIVDRQRFGGREGLSTRARGLQSCPAVHQQPVKNRTSYLSISSLTLGGRVVNCEWAACC